MVSGQLSVVSCQWSVVSGQLSVVSCQWSVVSGQLSVAVVSGQWELPLRHDPARGEMFIALRPPQFCAVRSGTQVDWYSSVIFRSERRWSCATFRSINISPLAGS